jgi:hypothetical protein
MGSRNGALFVEIRLRSGQSKNRVSITNKRKRFFSFSKGLERFLDRSAPCTMDAGGDFTVCGA